MDDIEAIKREVREAYARMACLHQKGIDFRDTLPEQLRGLKLALDRAEQIACWQKTLQYLEPKPGERHLDLGCGTGFLTYELHKLPCSYYGVDFCQETVDEVTRSLAKEKPSNVMSVLNADADDLPYDDRFFDLATCLGVLGYYPPVYRRKVLGELRRVLKHNGRAALDYPNPLNPRIYDALQIEAFRGSRLFLEDLADVEKGVVDCGFEVRQSFTHNVMMVYIVSPYLDWTKWEIA